jgi:hypothetical protein
MKRAKAPKRFALCLDNTDYPASLEQWKIYRRLPDPDAAAHRQLRVVDESGEDYLFPAACFKVVELSPALVRRYGRSGRGTAGRATIKTAQEGPRNSLIFQQLAVLTAGSCTPLLGFAGSDARVC